MTKLEKLYDRALRTPGSVRFSELARLLAAWGFAQRQSGKGTGHYFFVRGDINLSVPKHGPDGVRPVYVRNAVKALESIRRELEAENDNGEG